MSRKPVIACDVDDVVCDLLGFWLGRYNYLYDDFVLPEDILDWGIKKYATKCTSEEFYSIIKDPKAYSYIKPFPGALDAINRLKKFARVVFVTSCSRGTMDQKREWLERHGFLDGTKHVQHDLVMASDKALIRADCLIDDAEHNIEAFLAAADRSSMGGFLIARPHNASYTGKAPRVTLEEAVGILENHYSSAARRD